MEVFVSVALCTYNGKAYIEEQLLSILNQTRRVDEIIISDDNSQDGTVKIVKKILNTYHINYQVLVNKENLGVVKNFENAIKLCKGDIIFFSDQDDIWMEDKVAETLNNFLNNNDCIMTFSDAELVNENNDMLGTRLWDTLDFSIEYLEQNNLIDILLNRCVVTGATMAIRRDLFDKCTPFSQWWLHDGWISLNATLYGEVIAIEKPLIRYRQHSKNVIGASRKTSIQRIKKYINNINILEENSIERYERYDTFLSFNKSKLDDNIKIKLLECINYWQDMKKLNNLRKGDALKIVVKNYMNKNYKKYYTGFRGFLRDIIYIWIK